MAHALYSRGKQVHGTLEGSVILFSMNLHIPMQILRQMVIVLQLVASERLQSPISSLGFVHGLKPDRLFAPGSSVDAVAVFKLD